MKKLMITIIMVSALFMVMVQGASAYQITINQNAAYSYSNGGEFTVVSGDLAWISGAYTGYKTQGVQTGAAFNFETFCLEHGETFSPGTTYYAEINPDKKALGGGAAAGYDVISQGTAWLYQEFIKGTLKNYGYNGSTSTFSSRSRAAEDLQLSIWFLEDEGYGSASNYYANLAINKFGSLSNAQANFTGTGVSVLNVWTDSTKDIPADLHQDQLIGFPVPEPATMLLLGLGLLGLGISSRKLRK